MFFKIYVKIMNICLRFFIQLVVFDKTIQDLLLYPNFFYKYGFIKWLNFWGTPVPRLVLYFLAGGWDSTG